MIRRIRVWLWCYLNNVCPKHLVNLEYWVDLCSGGYVCPLCQEDDKNLFAKKLQSYRQEVKCRK